MKMGQILQKCYSSRWSCDSKWYIKYTNRTVHTVTITKSNEAVSEIADIFAEAMGARVFILYWGNKTNHAI